MLAALLPLFVACRPSDPADSQNESTPPGDSGDDTGTPRPPEGAELASLTFSQGTLVPAFRPSQRHYSVEAEALADSLTTVTAVPDAKGAKVEIVRSTMDGVPQESGPSPFDAAFGSTERIEVTVTVDGASELYTIVSLPPAFPTIDVRVATEAAWDGYLFLGDIPSGGAAGPSSQIFILDRAGVPVWFRMMDGPALDFKVNPNGELTYSGMVEDGGQERFAGFVLDDGYATVAKYEAVGALSDQREFSVLPDGNVITLAYEMRKVDFSHLDPECCTLRDGVFQELDPEGNVVFEWRTVDFFDRFWGDLPKERIAHATGEFDYVHLNSVDVDPVDGNWIIGSRFTSHVMKVARYETEFRGETYAPGEIVWTLGGLDSDWTFVNDERLGGWQGFSDQHDARMPSPNHLTVYDNSYWSDIGPTGDSRYVEYVLDTETMTATKVNEFSIAGSENTGICGSAARLPDGKTVIGWGNLANSFPSAPSLSEVTEDGEVVLEIAFSSDELSYRVGVGSWDPESGWTVAR
jgi:hypothetical protein